jgi:hypothetical protein
MFKRFRSRLTYANVVATLALLFALGTGGAYAANTIGSSDVIDESLLSQDIKNGEVKDTEIAPDAVNTTHIKNGAVKADDLANDSVRGGKILAGTVSGSKLADGAVTSAKVLDDTQAGGGLGGADLAPDSVGSSEIKTDAVNATEVADDSIDAGEIVDFGLSNQDVGVLFAQVNTDGTLANSSGGVTATRISAGVYDVDFGINISNCAFTATQGEAGAGGAGGAIMGATDRAGNPEAAFVTTRSNANALTDHAFQLVVVC